VSAVASAEPVRLLIAAMGGEGGGVLAGWITNAAVAAGLAVQRTSIPGVAQRTGATTYYLEIMRQSGAARPVLALNPAPGRVDVLVATELLEAARMVQAGFVTPDRTLLLASPHRVFTIGEKMAMSDGRLDPEKLFGAAGRFAKQAVLFDFADVAEEAKSPLNAVLLGALAASGALPVPAEALRAAIRADGKAVEANLRGFDAGFASAAASPLPLAGEVEPRGARSSEGREAGVALTRSLRDSASPASGRGEESDARLRNFPHEAAALAREGVRRLADYQDEAYAALYLDRLARFAGLTADAGLLKELARHLAVRMSVEDTIRVAQLKLREARLVRVRAEAKAGAGDIVHVTEFLKPGPEEILGILPAGLARPLLAFVERRGWMHLAWPMKVRTTSLSGYLRLKLLASLRRIRPRSLRFKQEEAWIARWLALVERSLAVDSAAAGEVVETAGLVKGYGETYRRGHASWRVIAEEVVEPMLAGALPRKDFADAVLQARLAALADPEGDRLRQVVDSLRRLADPPALAAE
jgi:indolepyruvate ferredoxin oxidoreductase beta subunit